MPKITVFSSVTANAKPIAANLLRGELAINTNDVSPGLFFRSSTSKLIKIGPATVSEISPSNPSEPELWWKNSTKQMQIYSNGTWSYLGNVRLTIAETAPIDPQLNEFWYNELSGNLQIYHEGQWVDAITTPVDNIGDRRLLGNISGGSADAAELTGPEAIRILAGEPDTGQSLPLNSDSGVSARLTFQTNGLPRWSIGKSSDAESGGQEGSNLNIKRFDNNGIEIGNALTIERLTGQATFSATPHAPTPSAVTNSTAIATTQFVQTLIANNAGRYVPVGSVMFFLLSALPTGWLWADGQVILRSSYAELSNAIYCGDANNATAIWGYRTTSVSNPSSNRNTAGTYIVLPDLRGLYVKGWTPSVAPPDLHQDGGGHSAAEGINEIWSDLGLGVAIKF